MRANYRAKVAKVSSPITERAVYAILSQGGAMAQTMVPIDTSNLFNSQYAPRIDVGTTRTVGYLGYTADYALYVHQAKAKLKGQDRPGNRGQYWDPNAEPKFLTKGFEKIKPSIPSLLKGIYRV